MDKMINEIKYLIIAFKTGFEAFNPLNFLSSPWERMVKAKISLIKSFCGGSRGAVFSKSAPLAAGGRESRRMGLEARSYCYFGCPSGPGFVRGSTRTLSRTGIRKMMPLRAENLRTSHTVHRMDEITKNRTKKNLDLSILEHHKNNYRRTSLSPTANFLKKVGQKLLIRPFGPGCFFLWRLKLELLRF